MPRKNKKKDKSTGKPKNLDGVGTSTSNDRLKVEYHENPVKRETDKNEYRVIKLPNGLVVLLIACRSDASSKRNECRRLKNCYKDYPEWYKKAMNRKEQKSCMVTCRLCINVGSFSDPRQVVGVSRLLSGTFVNPTFRKETEMSDDYKNLTKHSDINDNVIEDGESTVFGFCVTEQFFPEAISIFAGSFVSSLTTRHSVILERENMEKYYRDELADPWHDDIQDQDYLFANLLSAKHPVRTGGKYYLDGLCQPTDDKMYKEVLRFRKRHYSAHRMTVVMKARMALDVLESYAKDHFSKIPSNGWPPQDFNAFNFANSFDNTKFRKIWNYNDDDEDYDDPYYETEVSWIMPPKKWLYRNKSLEYIAWLINHGGTGSLVDYLKKKKWYHNLAASYIRTDVSNNSMYSIFRVHLELTEEGHKNLKTVLDTLYSYINLLKLAGPQEKIYDTIATIERAKFRSEINKMLKRAKELSSVHDQLRLKQRDPCFRHMNYCLPQNQKVV